MNINGMGPQSNGYNKILRPNNEPAPSESGNIEDFANTPEGKKMIETLKNNRQDKDQDGDVKIGDKDKDNETPPVGPYKSADKVVGNGPKDKDDSNTPPPAESGEDISTFMNTQKGQTLLALFNKNRIK